MQTALAVRPPLAIGLVLLLADIHPHAAGEQLADLPPAFEQYPGLRECCLLHVGMQSLLLVARPLGKHRNSYARRK